VPSAIGSFVTHIVSVARTSLRSFTRQEEGQDAFEYMLIIGGVSVAVVIAVALLATNVPGLRTATCAAIGTITTYAGFTC